MAALAADVCVGPWRLVRRLGAGGMGTVWEAAPLAGGAHVALKLMNDSPGASRNRFFDEARVGQRVVHPNVVRVLAFGEDDDRLWLAMELVSGRTVSDLVRPGLAPGLVVELGRQALLGLAAVHAHVVHRDVKPSNLLLTTAGEVKLIDFGIALGGGDERTQTRTGMLRGSLPYTSPENTRGEPLDHRADLFSLALVLHELLTGARVFDQPNDAAVLTALVLNPIPSVRARRPELPEALDAVVMRALERDQTRRFADADEMRRALEVALPETNRWTMSDVAQWLAAESPALPRPRPATDSISAPRGAPLAQATTPALDSPLQRGALGRRRARRSLPVGVAAVLLVSLAAAWALRGASSTKETPGIEAPTVPSRPAENEAGGTTGPPAASSTVASASAGPERTGLVPSPSEESPPSVGADAAPPRTGPPARPLATAQRADAIAEPDAGNPRVVGASPVAAVRSARERRPALASGFLTVDVRPSWAHVMVDGRDVGVTPAYRLQLPAGRHVVELRRDDGSSRKRLVTVQPEAERRLIVTW